MASNYQSAGQHTTDNAQQPDRSRGKRYKEIIRKYPRAAEAGKDLFVDILAGLAGAAVGAAFGRISLLAGAGVNFAGHYFNSKALSTFGTGMAVVNTIQANPVAQLNGTEEKTKWEKAKERLINYKDNLVHKLYLDKVFKKDETKTETPSQPESKPVGEIKHFVYPYESILPESGNEVKALSGEPVGEVDFSALDQIENKLIRSAKAFQEKTEVATPSNNVNGILGEIAFDPLY